MHEAKTAKLDNLFNFSNLVNTQIVVAHFFRSVHLRDACALLILASCIPSSVRPILLKIAGISG